MEDMSFPKSKDPPVQIVDMRHFFGYLCLKEWFEFEQKPNTCHLCRVNLFIFKDDEKVSELDPGDIDNDASGSTRSEREIEWAPQTHALGALTMTMMNQMVLACSILMTALLTVTRI